MATSNAADGTQFATSSSIIPKDIDPGKHHDDPHLENFNLRQYIDFSIRPHDLHKCWLSPYNKPCNGNWDEFYDAWKRVQIPYLDCNDLGDTPQTMSNDTRIAYQQQHNGLCELRHAFQRQGDAYMASEDFDYCPDTGSNCMRVPSSPSKEALHHFAYRLISMVQKQEQAVLGQFDGGAKGGSPGRWWIAPPNQSIQLSSVGTPDKARPDGDGDGFTELGALDQARFEAADYTVHWVCYQRSNKESLANDDESQVGTENSHLAVMIRERATGHTWYFDSLNTTKDDATVDLDEKHQSVLAGLHKWLSKTKKDIPAVPTVSDASYHRCVQVIPAELPWECGLHAIAHVLAFLRFGLLGWHEIPTYAREKTDKAKLTKLRHDMMKAMELLMGIMPPPRMDASNKIPLPEHNDHKLDLSTFRFPTYPSVGIEKKDLHKCEDWLFSTELDANDEESLRETYRRVHIEFYDGVSLGHGSVDPFTLKVYSDLHNGLLKMREKEDLEGEEVYFHATRLIKIVQDQEGAALGPAKGDNQDWWLAPSSYFIRCSRNIDTGGNSANSISFLAPEVFNDATVKTLYGDRSKDRERFDSAKYTVHWVHFSDISKKDETHFEHWAVLIREKATDFVWYFDSTEDGRKQRKDRAIQAFNEWLVNCRGPTSDVPKKVTQSFLVPAPQQSSNWDCGLHTIAHSVAFIRFGILGWHAFPLEAIALEEGSKGTGETAASAPSDPSERLRETMIGSLHGLMGVSLPPTPSKDAGNGTAEAVSGSNRDTNSNSVDKIDTGSSGKSNPGRSRDSNQGGSAPKPSDAMEKSTQPSGKSPAATDSIARHKGYKHAVPHPIFFSEVQYKRKGPGFRFPTYPSISLPAADVCSVNMEPFNARMELDNVYAYSRVSTEKPPCCDRVELGNSPYAEQAFVDINDALLNSRSGDWLEGKGMYHLASRLITYVQKEEPDIPPLGPFGNGNWWIAPHPFIIDVPGPDDNPNLQPARTFSDIDQGIWGFDSPDFGAVEERLFNQARYTVHFIHHFNHWTVIVREAETGHLWHFDSLARGLGRFTRAIDAFEDWLRRCHIPIPATSQAFQVPVTLQTQNWECSLHAIANAMAMLRFGILGWDKLPCLALETDPDPDAPAHCVTADNLREIMKRSLHGIFGLMLDQDVPQVAERKKQEAADLAQLEAMIDDSMMNRANMSFEAVLESVTNDPGELDSLNRQERQAREVREKNRKEQKEKDEREMKERFRRAQAERNQKAREELEKEKEREMEKELEKEQEREKEQEQEREKEKENQQQGPSNSHKRGAADDDDDESSGRLSKRSKHTPEDNPTENPAQSPNNKRKTPPPGTEPEPAKRARRKPTPAPEAPVRKSKAPVRKSERQRKATEKAEAAQEGEAATKLDDDGVEPDWRQKRRARFKTMRKADLIEECKKRLIAGPGDEHRTLTYRAKNTVEGLIDELMWYDEPEGYEEDLEGKSWEELKEMCKTTYKLYYSGKNAEVMKNRLRWFYAEQQRHVQTLIKAKEIRADWNEEKVVEEDDVEEENSVVQNDEDEGDNREGVEEMIERGDKAGDEDEEYSEEVSEEP